jgi:hypothetical protein
LNQPVHKDAWLGGAAIGKQEYNSSFSMGLSVKGNVFTVNRMYVKQGKLEFKNYAHGSGQIDNDVILQTFHKNNSIADYGGYKVKGLTPNNLYNISRSLDSCTWFQGIIPFGI